MYMDPSKGENRYCNRKSIAGKLKRRELESLLHCVDGLFGITRRSFEPSGWFQGTLFWLPLRQSPSDLSSTVYTCDRVRNLLAAFKTEAGPSMLLFLNTIERVELFTRDDGRSVAVTEETFSVGISDDCLEAVRNERERFVSQVRRSGDGAASAALPPEGFHCVTEVTMETKDHSQWLVVPQRETWLVCAFHAGQGDVSREMSELCSHLKQSYRPYVGVAAPLGRRGAFTGQVYCFLPLPQGMRSPTGLPVNVHGYFALSQNRRHLKWPSADQLSHRESLEAPLRWNCLLVEELLPKVYCRMLER